MSFREKEIKAEYRSLSDDIVNEFYIPLLQESILYRRAVGFFSSTALVEISRGITGLVRNGGKIQLVASPKLTDEDIEAINKGFELRDKLIEKNLIESLEPPKDIFEKRRLNLLANLIASGKLDIKIAFTNSNNSFGMFHEKMGLLYDEDDNIIAFTGSMNETSNAFSQNYESIDVFCSWTVDEARVSTKERAFSAIWENYEPNVSIIDFPNVSVEIFKKYKVSDYIDLEIDTDQYNEFIYEDVEKYKVKQLYPRMPKGIQLHDYQIEAIDNWQKSNYRGIYDMATGTGKTYTGLASIVRLFENSNKKLGVVIVCPYQHLVEQWVEDIRKFNMRPIIAYSASKQKDWKKLLKDAIIDFNIGVKNHFCLVTTNATYSSEYVQKEIKKLRENVLLLVDEAHNFGSERLSEYLNGNIQYRLALSATLERHNDDEGTQKLFNYFGNKNIEYTLERAIQEEKLTPYYYYPKVVYLNEIELERYKELTKKIAKLCVFKENEKVEMSKSAEMLLIERAKLVAGANGKVDKLKEIMNKYKKERHILVYCGATTINDVDYAENDIDPLEVRQIDAVVKMLGLELNMNVSKFTSEENSEEREILKKEFLVGDNLQVLVAIRCLDEGVNIPNIRTAFILASSTNPKEYIQRRGRVLRKAEGKSKAVIYDFVTLPRPIEDVELLSPEDLSLDLGLVKREILRIENFASISENSSVADNLLYQLKEAYKINLMGEREYEWR